MLFLHKTIYFDSSLKCLNDIILMGSNYTVLNLLNMTGALHFTKRGQWVGQVLRGEVIRA